MAPKHHGDNDDLTEQLQPLVDDDAFLTELSKGNAPSDRQDDLAELLLELKGDVDKQLSLIHISEPTRREWLSRMPSSA